MEFTDFDKKVFDIKDEPLPKGAWWYWLWLFFFNDPKNPEVTRQAMVLWSTKNEKEIECNNLKLKINCSNDKSMLNGAVAAWYFDGERMHHNFLLEQCNINITEKELSSDSYTPTSFSVNKNKNLITIGKDFKFLAEARNDHAFSKPSYRINNYIGKKGYSIMELRHLNLSGKIKNESIRGSAYFQRVFFNMIYPSWYWGIFHFDSGSMLTYSNPYLFGKSLKEKILFLDDNKVLHEFRNMKVKKIRKDTPIFLVNGENKNEKINFVVNSYSHTSWTFRKKHFGFIPNKLVYNQYPSVISDFKLTDKKTGKTISLKDIGKSVGNAENGVGMLL